MNKLCEQIISQKEMYKFRIGTIDCDPCTWAGETGELL